MSTSAQRETQDLLKPEYAISNNDTPSRTPSAISASLPRASIDSIITVGTTTTLNGSRRFLFSNGGKSGSMSYSPLGNNSIYEIVMNTRNKHWLQPPTNLDIPPITLSKNVIDENWRQVVTQYVDDLKKDIDLFTERNNLKNTNRIEEMREYQKAQIDETPDGSDMEVTEEETLLGQIPELYFDKSFRLDNERTFHRVISGVDLQLDRINDETVDNNDDTGNISIQIPSHNAYLELKDKLTDYLDQIEFSLVSELSKSSHKFFYALSEVENIQHKTSETIMDLDSLADTLKEIDESEVLKRVENVKDMFKRKNVEKLEQGMLQIKLILTKVEACKELYQNSSLDECMELISSVDCLIRGDDSMNRDVQSWTSSWPYKLVDLKSVPALSSTREFLTNMKIEIGGKYSLKLAELLLNDLRESYENIDIAETLLGAQGQGGKPQNYLEFDPEFKEEVKSYISKLNDCEELTSSFQFYQTKFTAECKSIIKKFLPKAPRPIEEIVPGSEVSGDTGEGEREGDGDGEEQPLGTTRREADTSIDSIPQRQAQTGNLQSGSGGTVKLSVLIRSQTPAEFQEMLVEIFTHCIASLRHLYKQQKLLLDTALNEVSKYSNRNDGNSGTTNDDTTLIPENQASMVTQLDIRPGINDVIGILQLRMARVINVRRDITVTLDYKFFLRQYVIIVLFIQECEALSGEFLTKSLSDVLAYQIKGYLSNLEVKSKRTLQKKIELDNWVPFVVKPEFQSEVNRVFLSGKIDPLDWGVILNLGSTVAGVPTNTEGKDVTEDEGTKNTGGSITGHRKSIVVGDKTFVASDSLLTAISILKEALILSVNLPAAYLPRFEQMCYNILKNFNDYTSSSVTQPGKSLMNSGKNLSIMAETIDCLAEFVGIVQRFYQRLSDSCRDFEPLDPTNYAILLKQYQSFSEMLYQTRAPPPPAPI